MPYIAKEHRPELDKYTLEIISELSNSKQSELASFIYELLKTVYGDQTNTRYFLQNEMIGVLACMNFEWQDRFDINPTFEISFAALPSLNEKLASLVNQVLTHVPKDDHTLRPGHLNYFITILMRDSIKAGILIEQEVPNMIYALTRLMYTKLTRPYEDIAIEKNGDVFKKCGCNCSCKSGS